MRHRAQTLRSVQAQSLELCALLRRVPDIPHCFRTTRLTIFVAKDVAYIEISHKSQGGHFRSKFSFFLLKAPLSR